MEKGDGRKRKERNSYVYTDGDTRDVDVDVLP